MIRTRIELGPLLPFTRVLAARLATISGHFHCSLTLEQDGLAVNLKSMLGMLSQTMKPSSGITLVANGTDEKEATEAIVSAIKEYQSNETTAAP
ncbi:MAG: HPr family phosphocarrier protein [Clostridiales bacterium]|nr:HPr family phosphocarrier protein [Clostridiales bacterium]